MKNIVRRTTLIVRDAKKSARWYEHVIGMTRFHEDEIVLSGEGMAAGGKGDRTYLIVMKCEHPDIGMIGLLEWIEPRIPAPKEIPKSVTYGNPTFVCSTDDCHEVVRRARELGTRIHSEPHEWSVKGADGKMKRFLGCSVFDPDGYFYQFNQLLG